MAIMVLNYMLISSYLKWPKFTITIVILSGLILSRWLRFKVKYVIQIILMQYFNMQKLSLNIDKLSFNIDKLSFNIKKSCFNIEKLSFNIKKLNNVIEIHTQGINLPCNSINI